MPARGRWTAHRGRKRGGDGRPLGARRSYVGEAVLAGAERRQGRRSEHPPRRDTRFAAGDRAYLIGPYEELLQVLRRDTLSPTGLAAPTEVETGDSALSPGPPGR